MAAFVPLLWLALGIALSFGVTFVSTPNPSKVPLGRVFLNHRLWLKLIFVACCVEVVVALVYALSSATLERLGTWPAGDLTEVLLQLAFGLVLPQAPRLIDTLPYDWAKPHLQFVVQWLIQFRSMTLNFFADAIRDEERVEIDRLRRNVGQRRAESCVHRLFERYSDFIVYAARHDPDQFNSNEATGLLHTKNRAVKLYWLMLYLGCERLEREVKALSCTRDLGFPNWPEVDGADQTDRRIGKSDRRTSDSTYSAERRKRSIGRRRSDLLLPGPRQPGAPQAN